MLDPYQMVRIQIQPFLQIIMDPNPGFLLHTMNRFLLSKNSYKLYFTGLTFVTNSGCSDMVPDPGVLDKSAGSEFATLFLYNYLKEIKREN